MTLQESNTITKAKPRQHSSNVLKATCRSMISKKCLGLQKQTEPKG